MKKVSIVLAMLMAVAVSGGALAHKDHDHDDVAPAKAVDVKLDLVNKRNGAIVYATNGGAKLSTAGATGTLTLAKGAAKSEVALQSGGDNAMETKADTKMVKGAKATVSITFADKNTATANFMVK